MTDMISAPLPSGPHPLDRRAAHPPAAPAFGPSAEPVESGPDWRSVLRALHRFRWFVLIVTVCGAGLGVALTRFIDPLYVAQTNVWIDAAQRGAEDAGPFRSRGLLEAESWVDLLQSYVVLDPVARDTREYLEVASTRDTAAFGAFQVAEPYRPGEYRLTVDESGAGWVLTTADAIPLGRGAAGDSVGPDIGFRWVPPRGMLAGRTVEFTVLPVRDAARRLGERLNVRLDVNGSFLRVEMRGPDPRRVTAIVNAVAERYVEIAASLKREKLTELTRILEEQVGMARRQLDSAQAAYRRFRVATITLPADRVPGTAGGAASAADDDPVLRGFFNLQVSRDQVRRDREAIERLLAGSAGGPIPIEALATVGAVQQSAELSQALTELTEKRAELRGLRSRYSDAVPLVTRLAEEVGELEGRVIPGLARTLAANLAAREGVLERQVGSASADLRAIPARAVEGARLHRDWVAAEELHTVLQQRFNETRLAEASTIPDVRILDAAVVPQMPVENLAGRLILLGLCGGLGLACVGAVMLDRFDPRLRYPEQVSRGLGLPIIGVVPHLDRKKGLDAGAVSEVVEAFRGVCLNLVHAHGNGVGPVIVTVSSPGAGDGKSFITSNLALAFAEAGHRTLLIDADVRRAVIHRWLDLRRKPGLTDYLRGEAPLDAVIRSTSYPALSVLASGSRAQNAPELLGSPAMRRLLEQVRGGYDIILIDTPPLGAGVDPFIVGTLTGNLLLVIRTAFSHRDMTEAKLQVLHRLPVRILGAVLNDAPAGASYRYHSYYLPGYEAVEEPPARGGVVVRPRPS